jgi:hypothetical protein
MRMTVEDLDDHAGPIEHLGAGGALEAAGLARRDLVIDDHERRPRRRVRVRLGFGRPRVRLPFVGILEARAGFRLPRGRHRSDDTSPAGDPGEFRKPPLAEHRLAADRVALLRQRADDLVAERLHEAPQLLDARRVRRVVDARELNPDKDGARHRRFGFHDRGGSTNRRRARGEKGKRERALMEYRPSGGDKPAEEARLAGEGACRRCSLGDGGGAGEGVEPEPAGGAARGACEALDRPLTPSHVEWSIFLLRTRSLGGIQLSKGCRAMNLDDLGRVNVVQVKRAGARYTPILEPDAPNLTIESLLHSLDTFSLNRVFRDRIKRLASTTQEALNDGLTSIGPFVESVRPTLNKFVLALLEVATMKPSELRKVKTLIRSTNAAKAPLDEFLEDISSKEIELRRQKGEPTRDQRKNAEIESRLGQLDGQRQAVRRLLNPVIDAEDFLTGSDCRLLHHNCVLLLGDWGSGKTHFLCDLTMHRGMAGLPSLILLAHHLSTEDDVLLAICSHTGLAKDKHAFLEKLNELGARSSGRALLIIDGINEGDPRVWKRALSTLAREVESYRNIGLVLSCRRPFERLLAPRGIPNRYVQLAHPGFQDIELDAQQEFFRFYEIPTPEVPLLSEEFARPLALKLMCEAFTGLSQKKKEKGFAGIASGQRGMTYVLESFIKRIGADLSTAFELPKEFFWYLLKGSQNTSSGRENGFAVVMAKKVRDHLTVSEAVNIIDDHLKKRDRKHAYKLLRSMISHGLVVNDFIWQAGKRGAAEIVRLPYQRFSDHLIARHLLDKALDSSNAATVRKSLKPDMPIGKVFSPDAVRTTYAMPGLAEAITIEFPERVKRTLPLDKREIFYHLPKAGRDPRLMEATFLDGLFWRSSSAFSKQTGMLLTHYLGGHTVASQRKSFDVLVSLAIKHRHPYSSEMLWRYLSQWPMPVRDLAWTEYLRLSGRAGGPRKLLDWIERTSVEKIQPDVVEHMIRVLALTLTWTDRPARDRATFCLVKLGERFPQAVFRHVVKSLGFNDPYVSERMLASAYGIAMSLWAIASNRSAHEALAELAQKLFAEMFVPSGKHLTHHALARDYALGVISLARALDPKCIDTRSLKFLKPSYRQIPAPFPIPSRIDKSEITDGESVIGMDFGNYTIGRLVRNRRNYDFDNPTYKAVRRQIAWRIGQLGYSEKRFASIDREISSRHHFASAEDPGKTDRYGKKYSWIAYFEAYGWREARGWLESWRTEHRTSDCDLDPSFPTRPSPWKISLPDVFSEAPKDMVGWLSRGPTPNYRHLIRPHEVKNTLGPWTLLNGFIEERAPTDERRVFTFIRALLVKAQSIEKLRRAFLDIEYPGNFEIPEPNEDHYTFAGEIPWSYRFGIACRRKDGTSKPQIKRAFRGFEPKRQLTSLATMAPSDGDLGTQVPHAPQLVEPSNHSRAAPDETLEGLQQILQDLSGDIGDVLPNLAEKFEGLFSSTDEGELGKSESRAKRAGVVVEVPAYRFGWESYHCSLNRVGGAYFVAPHLCFRLGLRGAERAVDLRDSGGKLATIYCPIDDAGFGHTHLLYLRSDLLEAYLADRKCSILWLVWGERDIDPSSEGRVAITDDPAVQQVFTSHAHIHRTFLLDG